MRVHRIGIHRIAIIAAAVSAAVALALILPFSRRPTLPVATPWIPLPSIPLGQTDADSRWLLWYAGNRPLEANLALRCGNPARGRDTAAELDTYSIYTTESWDRPYIHAVLQVQASTITVRFQTDVPPPRELPPPPGHPPFASDAPGPVTVRSLPRQQMEEIRAAWASEALWLSPQVAPTGTPAPRLDGHTLFLEACVNGHYAARKRDSGSEEEIRLWHLLHSLHQEGAPTMP